MLDNINLLYVAMSRSEDRLYVISNYDSKKGSIYKYFSDFLIQHKESDFNNNIFSEGKRVKKKLEKKIIKNIKQSALISEEWRRRIRIRRNHVFNKNLKQKYSIYWGDLIHEIMAGINIEKDIETRIKKLNVETKYNSNVYKRIKKEITRIINDKRITHLFKPNLKVFSEHTILSEDGTLHRPDRVILHSNHSASLIDYKTGIEKQAHYNQMDKYETVLLKLGYKKINKYLIYLTTGNIKEL